MKARKEGGRGVIEALHASSVFPGPGGISTWFVGQASTQYPCSFAISPHKHLPTTNQHQHQPSCPQRTLSRNSLHLGSARPRGQSPENPCWVQVSELRVEPLDKEADGGFLRRTGKLQLPSLQWRRCGPSGFPLTGGPWTNRPDTNDLWSTSTRVRVPSPYLHGRGGGDPVLTCAVSHVLHWLLDQVMGFVDVK